MKDKNKEIKKQHRKNRQEKATKTTESFLNALSRK